MTPDRDVRAFRFRRPKSADKSKVNDLARRIFGPDGAGKFDDRWWWNDTEPHAWVAEHTPSGDIVAVCGARRTRLLVGGFERSAVAINDWYVSPDHAGFGLGRILVDKACTGCDFAYSNSFSDLAKAAFERLEWAGFSDHPMFVGAVPVVLLLGTRDRTGLTVESRVVSSKAQDALPEVDEIWRASQPENVTMMVRDSRALAEHVALARATGYSLFVARRGGNPVGYLLLRVLPPGALGTFSHVRTGLVVDYHVTNGDREILRTLVSKAALQLLRQKVMVLAGLATQKGHLSTLGRLGIFEPAAMRSISVGSSFSSRLMYRFLDGSRPGDLTWHMTFLDNDLDLSMAVPNLPKGGESRSNPSLPSKVIARHRPALRSFGRRAYWDLLSATGGQERLLRSLSSETALVLNLHRIHPEPGRYWDAIHPDTLSDLLAFLAQQFRVVSLKELTTASPDEGPWAVISFDDAYGDFVEFALPVLEAHGVRANLNVIAGSVTSGMPPWTSQIYDYLSSSPDSLIASLDVPGMPEAARGSPALISRYLKNRSRDEREPMWNAFRNHFRDVDVRFTPMMSADDVKAVSDRVEIGCHSFEHESMEFESDEYFRTDLDRCLGYFTQSLGLPLDVYAFPNGSYRPEQIVELKQAGIRSILLVGEGRSRAGAVVHPRITMTGRTGHEVRLRALGARATR